MYHYLHILLYATYVEDDYEDGDSAVVKPETPAVVAAT